MYGKVMAKWRAAIDEHSHSGQNVTAFCKERGISTTSFYEWRKRLEFKEDIGVQSLTVMNNFPEAKKGFERIDVHKQSGYFRIITPNGYYVQVPMAEIDTSAWVRILKEVNGL